MRISATAAADCFLTHNSLSQFIPDAQPNIGCWLGLCRFANTVHRELGGHNDSWRIRSAVEYRGLTDGGSLELAVRRRL